MIVVVSNELVIVAVVAVVVAGAVVKEITLFMFLLLLDGAVIYQIVKSKEQEDLVCKNIGKLPVDVPSRAKNYNPCIVTEISRNILLYMRRCNLAIGFMEFWCELLLA